MGRLLESVHRLTASREEIDAAEQLRTARTSGATPVAECVARRPARVAGVISSLTYRPRGETPALVARLYDGSGSVELIFLGRRDVPGIEPGRRLVAEGTVYDDHGRPAIFNPAYELGARGDD
ncbi:OB-fold nucleic acid binding domain-containing protein [Georgenia sp. M64]|jgi:hypothetical protein|uniref:OB-fold nucleic acid binding domain-containing protein n=1 Tax=Georgenia sp. M64 TaxID=3120520 RepID=UPI0030DEF539